MATPATMTNPARIKIRKALRKDAEQLAELTTQLGYPSTPAELRTRLSQLRPAGKHTVFVADVPGTGVIGWLHVSATNLLEIDLRAEVNGLVVAEGQRSLGAGAKLIAAAEDWARRQGCKTMNVRSNVIRDRAHKFYERQGYEHYKTQKAFRKPL
jgi:GNAT superfamily N-acetyltransferase